MFGLWNQETCEEHPMRFIVIEHESPHGLLVVITDKNIAGKKFKEGRIQLDLSSDFYNGEEKDSIEVEHSMKRGYILHLTGKETLALGIKLGLVEERNIIIIQGIPHAEVVRGG